MLKIQLMKPAKHAIARPLRGRAMACFADTNWALRTPSIQSACGPVFIRHGTFLRVLCGFA
jgi:hypothetical protein